MAADLNNNSQKSKVGGARPGAGRPKGATNKATRHVKEAAQQYTEAAILTLAEIMQNDSEPAAARVSAANALLDRGYGKPSQTLGDGDGNALDWIAVLTAARGAIS